MSFAGSINKEKDCVPLQVHGQRLLGITKKYLQRALPCTSFTGSVSLEAAVVLPVFMFIMILIMYFMVIINYQIKVQQVLVSIADDIGKGIVEMVQAEGLVSEELQIAENIGSVFSVPTVYTIFVEKIGSENIIGYETNTLGSYYDTETNDLNIQLSYKINMPFITKAIGVMSYTQCYKTKCWLGESISKKKDVVYITATGTVYHKSRECTHINLSIKEVTSYEVESLRNSSGGKYYACEKCAKDYQGETMYITSTGDCYHVDINCSGLKRGIIAINIEEVGDRKACSRCFE